MNHITYQDTKLIPELNEWKSLNGDDFTIIDWISFHHSPELMIGFAEYFYPNFEERLGGVFFEYSDNKQDFEQVNEQIKQNLKKYYDNDMVRYQMLENHRHIWDFIATPENNDQITVEQISYLGNILLEIWYLKLKNDFPHLNIKVDLSPIDRNNLTEVNITFWAE